jgi:hypothetical protein
VPHSALYRVDGEVGRFRFVSFDLKRPGGQVAFLGTSLFPILQGREWYETSGFKEVALMTGAVERSYRKTRDAMNRHRRQRQGGTPLNTLRDTAESQGTAALEFMETESTRILKEHEFADDGTPLPGASVLQESSSLPATLADAKVEDAWSKVERQMQEQGVSQAQIQHAAEFKKRDYEDPQAAVNIHVDDVGVKKQKERRVGSEEGGHGPADLTDPEGSGASQAMDRKRPMFYATVARIEHTGQGFTLAGGSVVTVLRFVLAFLLGNGLVRLRWLFFTDGQRNLQNTIVAFFSWHRCMSLILDWYRLIKKCKDELSLALKGRHVRNRHLKQIARLLWYGLSSDAIEYVRAIPEEDTKSRASLERLAGYFERNRGWIPCYALRRQLGLKNSSNPVERMNNLVTSTRQKKNGMSWSEAGSLALTVLTTIANNGLTQKWVSEREIPFAFRQAG